MEKWLNEMSEAMGALLAAIPRAKADLARPVFHFTPPAQWMNDINGTMFLDGFYHIFYQHNPFGDMPMAERLAHMHWGHARSRDFVNWEHLPIALAPSFDKGEKSCWSGCATMNDRGQPTIIYTAVFEDEMPFRKPFEQWMAIGDEALMMWRKAGAVSLEIGDDSKFSQEWRDPYIFNAGERTFLILGACGEAGVPLFEAVSPTLSRWKHVGRLVEANVECPNFFPLNGRWMFISSPFGLVNYSVGSFGVPALRFSPETSGTVDSGHYYGTNTLVDNDGRCILLGWIPGWNWELFQSGRGWNGCMSLPRILSLNKKDRLLQNPIPELQKLRRDENHVQKNGVHLKESDRLKEVVSDTCEISMELHETHREWSLRFLSQQGEPVFNIAHKPGSRGLIIEGASVTPAGDSMQDLKLHIFVDRCVIEVYVNDGEAVVSRMLPERMGKGTMEITAINGDFRIEAMNMWELSAAAFNTDLLFRG